MSWNITVTAIAGLVKPQNQKNHRITLCVFFAGSWGFTGPVIDFGVSRGL